jgi:hypothetical protein
MSVPRHARGMSVRCPCDTVAPVDGIPTVGEFVRYVCAFCNQATDDDPRYAHLQVDWPYSGESQALGAHAACLRAAAHPSIPIAVE